MPLRMDKLDEKGEIIVPRLPRRCRAGRLNGTSKEDTWARFKYVKSNIATRRNWEPNLREASIFSEVRSMEHCMRGGDRI
jgi:hypothetical protein